jgi:hypothetical protein
MMRWGRPRLARWAVVWEVMALEVREVRDSRWVGEEEDVMSGVRVRSVRWRERVGCWEGRFDMMMRVVLACVS